MRSSPTSPVNVLWTSGWDSTYRVADLLLVQGREVQPWYVMDSARMSTKRELDTMQDMREAFATKSPDAGRRLLPTKVFAVESIPTDAAITASFRELAGRSHLGGQYDWLARLAKAEDVQLELSIHKDDRAHGFLDGLTVADEHGIYRVAPDADLPVFERFLFPLFEMTKLEMQEAGERHGFADIQSMTWFCFNPLLDGKPCGFCNPCQYTREEGMGWRVPAPTLSRQLHFRALTKARQARKRVGQLTHMGAR
jgi:hypothetical protein